MDHVTTYMKRPSFDIKVLMARAGAQTAQTMAERCGLSRKAIHNRVVRGISWAEADRLAVRCGYLPWEVWPEWADVDPTEFGGSSSCPGAGGTDIFGCAA